MVIASHAAQNYFYSIPLRLRFLQITCLRDPNIHDLPFIHLHLLDDGHLRRAALGSIPFVFTLAIINNLGFGSLRCIRIVD